MVDLESVVFDGDFEFNVELNDGILSLVVEFELNISDPVIPVIAVITEEEVPFNLNSFFLSGDVDFKFNFDFMDVDIELLSDFNSVEDNIVIEFGVNNLDLSC